MNNDTYITQLGFVMDDLEIELRREQINEVARLLLSVDEMEDDALSDNEKVS